MTITGSEQQQFINLTVIVVEKNKIDVRSESTTYINEVMPKKIDINEMIKDFKKTCTKARKVGIRISNKNGGRDYIINNIDNYEWAYQDYLQNFEKAYELSRKVFVDNKLEVGTRDNKELQQIYSYTNNIARLNYRSGIIHIVSEFEYKIKKLKTEIEEREEAKTNGEELNSLTLFF